MFLKSLFGRPADPQAAAPAAAPAMFERLEDRKYMAAVPNAAKMKVVNLSAGGISTNQSLLTIPFSEAVEIGDVSKIRIRGYALETTGGGQKKVVINIVNHRVVDGDHRYIQLTTDRLMRKGGRIYFDPGSIQNESDGEDIAETVIRSPKGQNKERFTLANRAFRPTDVDKFTSDVYDGVDAPTQADDPVLEATVTTNLTNFLNKKVSNGLITAAQRDAALAQYNSAANKTIVPDANLRAAIVSLVGTIADAAPAVFFNGKNVSGKPYLKIEVAEPRPFAVYADTDITSTGRLRIRVREEFQGEDFRALSAILGHEALHQDEENGIYEEMIATALETVIYAQQVDVDNSLVDKRTVLVNALNTKLLAMLNSGRNLFPIVGLQQGPILNNNRGVFRDGKAIVGGSYTSFENFVRRDYEARGADIDKSPGSPTLRVYLEHFSDDIESEEFEQEILSALDRNLFPVITNPMSVRLARALDLKI